MFVFVYADCALAAHSHEDFQYTTDRPLCRDLLKDAIIHVQDQQHHVQLRQYLNSNTYPIKQSRNVTKYFYFVTLLKYKSLLFLSNEVHFLGSTFTCNEVQNMCTLSKCSEVLIISLLNLQMS